jgi:hypothetical protein
LTLCNTSSFLTRSVQLIFSILLQHHISKLSRYFCPVSEVSKFQHHTCPRRSTLLVYSLNLSQICWWREPSLVECCFCRGNLSLISRVYIASL